MKSARATASVLLLAVICLVPRALGTIADDWLDHLDEALSVNAFNGNVRARFSGTLDFEGYNLQQPAPGLLFTSHDYLFNPRLTVYLDAQIGPCIYAFAQGRVDRGFDPSDMGAQGRMDEYALRVTPWMDSRFNLQVGKFATVVGNWAQRHGSWENPFVTAPLPYENLTGLWYSRAPASSSQLYAWAHLNSPQTAAGIYSDKSMRIPVIWGPSYTSGISIFGALGKMEYGFDVKNSALSSPPEAWDIGAVGFSHPAWSGRIGFNPNEMWRFGVSASAGPFLLPSAAPSLPAGKGIGDYDELLLGQDVSFAWHHFELWAEFYEVRFQVPNVGNADTFTYYLEAKYKFTPQFFGALRWNQQVYGSIRGGEYDTMPWGSDTWCIDAALGYRFSEHMQLKLQYSIEHQNLNSAAYNRLVACQFTVRF